MLEVKNLVKVYKTKGGQITRALDDVSISFPETGLVFLLGKSGSGKSTLLNMLGGLDKPDSGEIIVKGKSSKTFSGSDFDSYRNTFIGFIFQEYNILNDFNVEQNIALALQLQGKKATVEEVNKLLEEVDLKGFNKRKPNTLSGGQKQRIAIARALIKSPEIIMADEPTGALDSDTGKQVFETLKKLSETKLIIVVSHDREFAEHYGTRIVELRDGRIISDISKEVVGGDKVNENINIISENTISIKNGKNLTDSDIKKLAEILASSEEEIIISRGKETTDNIKKVFRISEKSESEIFLPTKGIELKVYDGSKTKFIKSKMPMSRAAKMGATGLKNKPFRLISTIFLSVISFTLFGTMSTFMTFNPTYTYSEVLKESKFDSEIISKNSIIVNNIKRVRNSDGKVTKTESYEFDGDALFGVNEIKELNQTGNGNKFLGLINFTSGLKAGDLRVATSGNYYNHTYVCGFSDISESELNNYNFSLIQGKLPTKPDQIAITKYQADMILNGSDLLTSYSQIINQPFDFSLHGNHHSNYTFTVTGIVNVGEIPEYFKTLNDKTKYDELSREEQFLLQERFESYLSDSFHSACFVSNDFYETYKARYEQLYRQPTLPYERDEGFILEYQKENLEWVNSNSYLMTASIRDEIAKNNSSFQFFDFKGNPFVLDNLKEDEILVCDGAYLNAKSESFSRFYNSFVWDLNGAVLRNTTPELHEKYTEEEAEQLINDLQEYCVNYNEFYTSTDSNDLELETKMNDFLTNYYSKFARNNYLLNCMTLVFNAGLEFGGEIDRSEVGQRHNEVAYFNELFTDEIATLFINALNSNPEIITYIEKLTLRKYLSAMTNMWRYLNESELEVLSGLIIDEEVNEATFNKQKEFFEKHKEQFASYSGNIDNLSYKFRSDVSDFSNKPFVSIDRKIYYCDSHFNKGELNIVGYYSYGKNIVSDELMFVMSSKFIDKHISGDYRTVIEDVSEYVENADARYRFAITKTNYSQSQLEQFLYKGKGFNYRLSNPYFAEVNMFVNLFSSLSNAFLISGSIIGVFAGLMLLNFISLSITNKKKEIGILRAVGARGSDVFKIFYTESFIIGAICVVLSTIASIVTTSIFNIQVKKSIGITLLNFTGLNFFFILAVAIIMTGIATFIPVIHNSKKPPVDAIRSL